MVPGRPLIVTALVCLIVCTARMRANPPFASRFLATISSAVWARAVAPATRTRSRDDVSRPILRVMQGTPDLSSKGCSRFGGPAASRELLAGGVVLEGGRRIGRHRERGHHAVQPVRRVGARQAARVDRRDDLTRVGLVDANQTSAGEHAAGESTKEAHMVRMTRLGRGRFKL